MRRATRFGALILGLWIVLTAGSLGAQEAPRVELVPRVPAIPSLPGARNELRLLLHPEAGGPRRGILSVSSGLGILSVAGAEGPRLEVELRPGTPLVVTYRYDGPDLKGKPLREELDLTLQEGSVRAGFDVGMALEIQRVIPLPGARSVPGLPVPLRVEVADRFHPGANLPAWIAAQQGWVELRLEAQALDPGSPAPRTTGTLRCAVRERGGQYELVPQSGVPALMGTSVGRFRVTAQGALVVGATRSPLPPVFGELALEGAVPPGALLWMGDRIPSGSGEAAARGIGAVGAASALWPGDPRGAGMALAPVLGNPGEAPGAAVLRQAAGFLETLSLEEEAHRKLLQGILQQAPGGPWGLVRVDRGGLKGLKILDPAGTPYGGPVLKEKGSILAAFRAGQRLVLRLSGNGREGVTLTKVLPEGVRRKTYPAGTWEKSVTVYGDRLVAPAP